MRKILHTIFYISLGTYEENSFKNSVVLHLVINAFILTPFLCN